MACLLVCELPALGAVTLARSSEMRREWHTPVFFFCLFYFLLLSAPPPSSCCLLPILLPSLFLSSPFSLISSDVLSFLFYPSVPTFFNPLLLLLSVTSTFILILLSFCSVSLFCSYTHSSSPLSSTLVPVVFASASFSSNEINWCEMIHFHVFL